MWGLKFLEQADVFLVIGEIVAFVRIMFEIVQFELWSMNVRAYGLSSVVSIHSGLELGLPGRGCPQIGSKREGKRVGDVPDQFISSLPNHAHGIVHLDFVESMRRVDFVPTRNVFLFEDRQKRATMKTARRRSSGLLSAGGGRIEPLHNRGFDLTAVVDRVEMGRAL